MPGAGGVEKVAGVSQPEGQQWVVVYREDGMSRDEYVVYSTVYSPEESRVGIYACLERHPDVDVWAAPARQMPYPKRGGDGLA